jgi:tetratricopeptide (TPR) repeat protein/predicted Ser/Thr protein kinase
VCPGEETVAAYVAGRLPRDERDVFDSHLDTCSACHELLATLGKVGARHAELAPPPTSLGVGSTSFGDEATSWAPGDQLGRYVLLARLGEGGMGVVYAAYDPELDRKVALKLLRHTSDDARERLRDEARAIAKLQHPNVVAVHDVGDAGGDVFVAMEHVDGVTLSRWLQSSRSPAEIIAVFAQAGRGLAAAHAAGLVHRDVKPSNIIIGNDGRARVLDFGLARARAGDDSVVGTPAYMAPEQQRGERVDARADQYAFCLALWEALGGTPPGRSDGDARSPDEVPDRVVRALRRGLAASRDDRFPSLDAVLHELAPPEPRGRRWMIATAVAAAALATAVIALVAGNRQPTASCARAGGSIDARWGDAQRAELRSAFDRTRLPYAASAATAAVAQLDAWTARWRRSAETSCRATVIDRVQPAELHGLRQTCLDHLAERFAAVVTLTRAADAGLVANAGSLAAGLPAPERCDDVSGLSAVEPPPETIRAEVASLRAAIATTEAAMLAGRLDQARPEIAALAARSATLDYQPLRARTWLLVARLEQASARYDEALAALHAGARAATAARDLELLAEIWIELTQTLGNDVATLEQADIFDGYAATLVELLPDRDTLALQLDHARCSRNISHTRANDAAILAGHCQSTIERAGRARPPRTSIANVARSRLGHFQRLLGQPEEARATLIAAVAEAERVHGADHPDTAVARYSLGIAEISQDRYDEGIAQLRQALAIRRAAFPGDSLHVVESLLGLGDALASKGEHTEAIPLVEQGLAMLETLGKAETVHAVNGHVLLGMSLEEVARPGDASQHYLRAADIADRAIQHREKLAAMALGMAAEIAVRERRIATAVELLERGLRLLERAKARPLDLARTQHRLAGLLAELAPTDRRARAMAELARASYLAAGDAGAEGLAELAAMMRKARWR